MTGGEPQRAFPEMDLLLACARPRFSEAGCARVKALVAEGLDWDLVLELADRHKTLPLLYTSLSQCPVSDLPRSFEQRLQQAADTNAQRNLLLVGELLRVVEALASCGVQGVAYRGPVLARRAYGDVRLRQFNDLDLLVRQGDVERATSCLVSLGYREKNPHAVDARVNARCMHHQAFVREGGRVLLELHWQITPRYFGYTLDASLWDRLDSVELAQARVPTLGSEDLLVVLCVHGALHGWSRLAWICDVAELAAAQQALDWDLALELSRRGRARRMLLLGLCLAHDVLGARLPPGIWECVQADRAVATLAGQVKRSLFCRTRARRGPASRYPLLGLHLGLRESVAQKAAHCLRVALVPSQEDWEMVRLPPSCYALYYLVRPFRLLGKHSGRLLSGGQGEQA